MQQVNKAQASVEGSSETLAGLSSQLDAVTGSLRYLEEEERLRTVRIEEQVSVIIGIAEKMKEFFGRLQAKQKKSKRRQLAHALISGDKDDNKLIALAAELSSARAELLLRVSIVNVGLIGNVHDGFQVAQRVVIDINGNVERILGTQLLLARILQDKRLNERSQYSEHLRLGPPARPRTNCIHVAQPMVPLTDSDVRLLKLEGEGLSHNQALESNNHSLTWRTNMTGDDPRIFTGNVGIETPEEAPKIHGTVEGSTFGKGLRFVTGHMGGTSANDFNKNFWGS